MLTLNIEQLLLLAQYGINLDTSFQDGVGTGVTVVYDPLLGYEASKHQKVGQYLDDQSAFTRLPFVEAMASILPLLGVGTTPTWTDFTLASPWTQFSGAYPNASYYLDPFGVVHLRGVIAGGTEAQTILTLPAAIVPTYNQIVATNGFLGGSSISTVLNVNTSGTIVSAGTPSGTYAFLSMDNISYRLR